jgi:CMP/dCMP kinase
MRIAIDGPAGAGKSTVARAVADALGYTYLDSGAMYRAAAYKRDAHTEVQFRDGRVFADGEDVTEAIRLPEVTELASELASDPERRKVILAGQRALVAEGDWVIDGRDAANAIAPEAELKVFLTAAPEERARRRAAQIGGDWRQILEAQNARDAKDNTLGRSVLEPVQGAVVLDSTGLSEDEVVARIVALTQ